MVEDNASLRIDGRRVPHRLGFVLIRRLLWKGPGELLRPDRPGAQSRSGLRRSRCFGDCHGSSWQSRSADRSRGAHGGRAGPFGRLHRGWCGSFGLGAWRGRLRRRRRWRRRSCLTRRLRTLHRLSSRRRLERPGLHNRRLCWRGALGCPRPSRLRMWRWGRRGDRRGRRLARRRLRLHWRQKRLDRQRLLRAVRSRWLQWHSCLVPTHRQNWPRRRYNRLGRRRHCWTGWP